LDDDFRLTKWNIGSSSIAANDYHGEERLALPLHKMCYHTKMKSFIACAFILASAAAFAPQPGSPVLRSTSALSASPSDDRSPNPIIKVMAQGMGLLKPLFAAEAQIQATILGKLTGVDEDEIEATIAANKKSNKVLIYTYGLSPFSSEAVSMLEASGYDYEKIELGAEWFLLGGKESVTRVALAKQVENGATSLPKIFIGGQCIGGCSELAGLVESKELDALMKKSGVTKKGAKKSLKMF
jgi:glutaredoxin-related protein